MTTLAGKALVPFEGDFSSLLSSAAEAASSAGGLISKMVPVAVVGAIAGVGAAVIDLASKYNSATAQMAANSGITITQAQRIGAAFLATGGQTTFTAQQMMEAFAPVSGQLEFLNGGVLSVAQSTGFMHVAMDLAEASGQQLGSTTKDLTSVMQAFAIPVSGASAAADDLYNTSRALGVPIDSLTTSLQRARTAAGAAAPSMQDLSAFLLDLAAHGESGRGAMTLLGSALTGIEAPTKAVAAEQATLGVSFLTSTGQLKPLQTIIGEVSPLIAGMGNAQATATLKSLGFGAASSKLVDLMQAGAPAFDAATAAVSKTGTAQAGAATATDTLEGSFDRLKSRVIDAATSFGETLMPAVSSAMGWISTTGLTDLEEFGTWLDNNIIKPFVSIASVILPPVVTAMGWVFSQLHNLEVPALALAATLAGMWAVDKIQGWVSAAQGALAKLGIGGGASGASGVASMAEVQKVFVVNMAEGGLGAAGAGEGAAAGAGATSALTYVAPIGMLASNIINVLGAMTPLINQVKDGFASLDGGVTQMAKDMGISAAQAATFSNFLGPLNSAMMSNFTASFKSSGISKESAANQSLYMAALAAAIKSGQVTTQAQLDAFDQSWATSINNGDGVSVQMGQMAKSSAAAAAIVGVAPANLGAKLIVWENALEDAGVSGSVAAAAQASLTAFVAKNGPATATEMGVINAMATQTGQSAAGMNADMATLSTFVAQHGPLTSTQMLAVQNAMAYAGTNATDINITLKGINDAMAPAVADSQQFRDAVYALMKNAQAATHVITGLTGGGGYTAAEGGVANAPPSGQMWLLHGQEAIVPKSKAGWLWEPMLAAISAGQPPILSPPVTPSGMALGVVASSGASSAGGGGGGDTYVAHLHVTGFTDQALVSKLNDAIGRWHGQALALARAKGRR